MKEIAILYNQVSENSAKDELDVLVQVAAVEGALRELGFQVHRVPFGMEIPATLRQLQEMAPSAIFNLAEGVASDGRLIHFAPAVLDHLRIPYTGCSTEAVFITSNKVLCKKWLRVLGIRTPDWVDLKDEETYLLRRVDARFIIKSVWEHGSSWFSEESLVAPRDVDELIQALRRISKKKKGEFYAERFVPGREFNVAVLAGEVLAIPEIIFNGYPSDKPQVVDYRAKWEESSFEYQNTHRRFEFKPEDKHLLTMLQYLALECWRRFCLRGYARIDFRVDERGIPWVIEINSNPCISPDAGFFAAARQSGLTYNEMIRRILADSGIQA